MMYSNVAALLAVMIRSPIRVNIAVPTPLKGFDATSSIVLPPIMTAVAEGPMCTGASDSPTAGPPGTPV